MRRFQLLAVYVLAVVLALGLSVAAASFLRSAPEALDEGPLDAGALPGALDGPATPWQ